MKNLVTSLLGLAFLIVGCNIANIVGGNPQTNLQTVAASTVQQPMDHLFDQVKITNPDTVHDTIKCLYLVNINNCLQRQLLNAP